MFQGYYPPHSYGRIDRPHVQQCVVSAVLLRDMGKERRPVAVQFFGYIFGLYPDGTGDHLLKLCRKEGISFCTYSGIGGCGKAVIQTFIPETGEFESTVIEGMLELAGLTGNIISDDEGVLYHHTHAVFAYKSGAEHLIAAGHIKSVTVSNTAEITLKPVTDGIIKRQFDPETGTGFWRFD